MLKLTFENIFLTLNQLKNFSKNFTFSIINENKNLFISSATINSKGKNENSLFFAIKGKNVNGLNFLLDAKENGAKYFLVEKENWENRSKIFKNDEILKKIENLENVIVSNDPEKTFLFLARAFLNLAEQESIKKNNIFHKIIITGSTGKTTTKNFLSFALKNIYGEEKVFASEKNLNNSLGVPLNIFKLTGEEKICIFEVGISNKNEMDILANIINPDVGVILNIGPSHLEYLKDLQGVCDAKWELVKHIKKNGVLCLNISDFHEKENFLFEKLKKNISFLEKNKIKLSLFGNIQSLIENKKNLRFYKKYNYNYLKFLLKTKICFFGKIGKLDYDNFYTKNFLEQKISVFSKRGNSIFTTKILENAGLSSLLAVISIAKRFNINVFSKKFKNIISKFSNTHDDEFLEKKGMRFFINKKNNIFYINDAYNANPISMENSLKILSKIDPNENNKIVILGDMLELGKEEDFFHKNLAKKILDINFKKVILIGEKTKYTFLALKGYLNDSNLKNFTKLNEFYKKSNSFLDEFIKNNILKFENVDEFIIFLEKNYIFEKNDIVFIKGSRKMKLEKIIDFL